MRPKRKTAEKMVMSFRVDLDVHREISAAAAKERRTIANWIELAVEQVLVQRGFLKGK